MEIFRGQSSTGHIKGWVCFVVISTFFGSKMRLNSLTASLASLLLLVQAIPEVQLGETVLLGRAVSDTVEFFGGGIEVEC